MVVLDLSASISSDTFSRIGETLRKLVATDGRYGLVVFSNVAYEALPPGHARLGAPTADPLLHACRHRVARRGSRRFPTNPWTLSLQQRHADLRRSRPRAPDPAREPACRIARVVLISDLADDPQDVQRPERGARSTSTAPAGTARRSGSSP